RPPPSAAISMRAAPASSAFSTSSFTTLAGRSTTSPAAMRLTTASESWRTGMGATHQDVRILPGAGVVVWPAPASQPLPRQHGIIGDNWSGDMGHSAMLSPVEITSLLASVAKGDEEAFERLYAATRAKVYGVVLRILRRHDLASDVMEAAYEQIRQTAGE